jgi:ER degradation enhancer, mannosidase alpha-like 1
VESAYHLYSATGDLKYIHFAKDVLFSLQNKSRVKCGYASVADVMTGRLDDRMDSYFLAETLKYLFLLFDEVHLDKISVCYS